MGAVADNMIAESFQGLALLAPGVTPLSDTHCPGERQLKRGLMSSKQNATGDDSLYVSWAAQGFSIAIFLQVWWEDSKR